MPMIPCLMLALGEINGKCMNGLENSVGFTTSNSMQQNVNFSSRITKAPMILAGFRQSREMKDYPTFAIKTVQVSWSLDFHESYMEHANTNYDQNDNGLALAGFRLED